MENHGKLAFRDAFEHVSAKCGHLSIEELSAGAQRILEETFVNTVRDAHARYGLAHVLLAGGTFANVRLNQKILEIPGIESVYVHPNMGDGGIAVGSALLLAAEQGEARPYELRDVYWGDDWSDAAIRAELERSRGIQWRRLDDPADAIGDAMADKQGGGRVPGSDGVRAARPRPSQHPGRADRHDDDGLAQQAAEPHRVHAVRADRDRG